MKRHRSLHPLTHDHHHALVHAHRLMKAALPDAEMPRATIDAFFAFIETKLRAHFEAEEAILGPPTRAAGDIIAIGLLDRMFEEHREFWALLAKLADDVKAEHLPVARMTEVGEMLEAHVRFEERELFPVLEQALPEDELLRIGAELEKV